MIKRGDIIRFQPPGSIEDAVGRVVNVHQYRSHHAYGHRTHLTITVDADYLDGTGSCCGIRSWTVVAQPEIKNSVQAATAITFHDALVQALAKLVERCDGAEGVRADGSNIDTRAAHALLNAIAQAK